MKAIAPRFALALAFIGSFLPGGGARAALPPLPAPSIVVAEYYTFVPGYRPVCDPGQDTCDPPDDTHRRLESIELHLTQGQMLYLFNADPAAFHTLAAQHGQAEDPLFDSGEPISAGHIAPVIGTDKLVPGQYRFWCELHTNLMQGLLIVDPAS